MSKQHHYSLNIRWTGNKGEGTTHYRSYSRDHIISAEGKPDLSGSSDPAFLGNRQHYNPEDLLLASLSSCHMLWYLHLCADAGVIVVDYTDQATATMMENGSAGGRFTEAVLHPVVTVAQDGMTAKALQLHAEAHRCCFIANSVNFPVRNEAVVRVG
jgi:organic hydroperoxide reductase OsmC/OhrA